MATWESGSGFAVDSEIEIRSPPGGHEQALCGLERHAEQEVDRIGLVEVGPGERLAGELNRATNPAVARGRLTPTPTEMRFQCRRSRRPAVSR